MTSVLKSPDGMSSSRRSSAGGTSVLETIPDIPVGSSVLNCEFDRHSVVSSRSVSPAARYGSPRQSEQDVPFFTVARYRNPTAPITYELAAVPSLASTPEIPENLPELLTSPQGGGGETYYNGALDLSPLSPLELAFGKSIDSGSGGEWLGKSITQSPRTPKDETDRCLILISPTVSVHDVRSPRGDQVQTPIGCVGSHDRLAEGSSQLNNSVGKSNEELPIRGCVNFSVDFPKPIPCGNKPKPCPKPKPKETLTRRISAPPQSDDAAASTSSVSKIFSSSQVADKKDLPGKSVGSDGVGNHFRDKHFDDNQNISPKVICDNNKSKRAVYEDASVTDAAEKLENQQHQTPPITPRSRNKSREPSFCLEFEENFPKTDSEYMAILQKKITEAHERQLLPLKEDLADWISKLLELENVTMDNLIASLDNGVILCRLASLISSKAQEARDKGISPLEVPRLPYRTWGRARSGTFFARDNITNFIRFCKRLGVHSNLLFETEDLVCGTGVRGVVLCLMEVGRLAQLWWGLEPPGLVKLERELDGEELSGRSDSGFSNTSSPRDSTLALHSNAPISQNSKPARPVSAPSQLPLSAKLKIPEVSSTRQKSLPRGPKPTPPPKPASIRRAVSNLTKRPSSFPTSRTYDRGWSGAKTTPTTPVTTPTHAPKTRLPVAKTPRSSGRSTPNTTPTTPTQCRRYMVSMQRTPSKIPTPKAISVRCLPGKTPSKILPQCSRFQDALKSPNPDDEARSIRSDLDNKVQDIAQQTHGLCSCRDITCQKQHIKRVSDGKYDILGKSVFVRLLKGKHVMVRVGGGWDTLEHYLLRHNPSQVRLLRTRSNYNVDPARSKFRPSTPSEKSIRKSNASSKCSSTSSRNGDSWRSSSSKNDDDCYSSGRTSPSDTVTERSLMDDNQQILECLEEVSPNSDLVDDKTLVPCASFSTKDDTSPEDTLEESKTSVVSSNDLLSEDCSKLNDPSNPSAVEDCISLAFPQACHEADHLGCCEMISAPMGENGDFQPPPCSLSTTSLNKMVTSCPTLDLAESVSDLTSEMRKNDSDAEFSECEDQSSTISECDK